MKPGAFSFPVRQELATPALSRGLAIVPLHQGLQWGGAWVDPTDPTRVLLLRGPSTDAASALTNPVASRWDPTTGQQVMAFDASTPGQLSEIAMGLDGTLYTFGGNATTGTRAIAMGALAAPSWVGKAAAGTATWEGIACTLADGTILVVDGHSTTTQIFTPGSPGTWATKATAPAASVSPFYYGGAWLLPNGHVAVHNASGTWWDYDVGGNSWSQPSRANLGLSFPASRQVDQQGRIWMTKNGTLWYYSFAADVQTDTGIQVLEGTPVALPDGRVVIFGVGIYGNHWAPVAPRNPYGDSFTGIQVVS